MLSVFVVAAAFARPSHLRRIKEAAFCPLASLPHRKSIPGDNTYAASKANHWNVSHLQEIRFSLVISGNRPEKYVKGGGGRSDQGFLAFRYYHIFVEFQFHCLICLTVA